VDQLLYSQQHQPHRHLLLVLPAFQLVLPPSNQPQQLRTQPQRPQQQQASQPALQQQQPKAVKQGGTVPDTVHVRVPSTKPELLQALQEGSVREFDCGVFAPQKQVRPQL
jgi:hypothetical protein